ncbi:MAG: hypothetical protein EB121_00950, partial [Alphaproteobacteria bacterium]|nr:hypothetical protein [Alphaproteobacteria bacterium]
MMRHLACFRNGSGGSLGSPSGVWRLVLLAMLLTYSPAFAQTSGTLLGAEQEGIFFGLLIGILLTACCYLFFTYLVFRTLSQVALIAMLLSLVVHLTMANDTATNSMGLAQVVREYLENISYLVFFIASLAFTLLFLEVEENQPHFSKPLVVAIGVQLVFVLLTALYDRKLVNFLLPMIGAITIGFILMVGLSALHQNIRGSRVHILAFTIFLVGGLARPLVDVGFFTSTTASESIMYIASAASAIVFAVVVAGQFTALQEAAARDLSHSNERFQLAAAGANEGLFDWNFESGEIYFSDRYQQICGVRLPRNRQGIRRWLGLIARQDRQRITQRFRSVRREKNVDIVTTEYRIQRPDGKRRYAQKFLDQLQHQSTLTLNEIALVLGDGQVLPAAISARAMDYHQERAVVLGLYDLSERKSAEAQIAKQQEALQQSEKMAALGGLLAGVAHELNNPLSVIVGQATLLGETAGDDKTKSRAEKIFKAAERCSRIVKSFLSIARRKPPERKEMQLNDIVPSALDLLAYQIRHENVTLEQQLAPHLPRMIGDHDQLVQVLTNLVLNAVQAMDGWKGPKNITIRSWYDAGDYRVNLAVSDTGPGVPAHIRTRIFEPFFTTKAPGTGTGVGLSLCLNIVEAHGGRLMLEDTAGGGATFVLCMPVAERRTKDAATTDDALTQPLSPL